MTTPAAFDHVAHHRSMRSALRSGYEDQDYELFLSGLRARSIQTASGCWEWQGKVAKGYPITRIASKDFQVHRLVIEAREGKALGALAAHHKCANSICVSPEHLQPVTHRDNIAEMMARSYYTERIAELEAAIRAIDPSHEVLNRVSHVA